MFGFCFDDYKRVAAFTLYYQYTLSAFNVHQNDRRNGLWRSALLQNTTADFDGFSARGIGIFDRLHSSNSTHIQKHHHLITWLEFYVMFPLIKKLSTLTS